MTPSFATALAWAHCFSNLTSVRYVEYDRGIYTMIFLLSCDRLETCQRNHNQRIEDILYSRLQ
jgi:hypothetical protein